MTDHTLRIIGTLVGAVSAIIASSAAMVSWSYDTFETKEIGKERLATIEKRLDRIESKIDSLRKRD